MWITIVDNFGIRFIARNEKNKYGIALLKDGLARSDVYILLLKLLISNLPVAGLRRGIGVVICDHRALWL